MSSDAPTRSISIVSQPEHIMRREGKLSSMVFGKSCGQANEKEMLDSPPREIVQAARKITLFLRRPSFRKLHRNHEILQRIEQASHTLTMPRKAPTPLKVKKNIFSDVVSKYKSNGKKAADGA